MTRTLLLAVVTASLVLPLGCGKRADVVLYTSVDREIAEPIIREFERRTGLIVELHTDTEATRTAGLAERLAAEKSRPQADVWWGNEMFHTIRLAESDVLTPYESPSAGRIASQYKDAKNRWAGNGLRIRMIAVTTSSSGSAADTIQSIEDLKRPELKGRICMARPTAGTTGTQMAALYTIWGPKKTEEFLRALKDNGLKLVGGNSNVVEYVGQGQMWAGLTDNDDVSSALREGGKLKGIIPDQQPGAIGTLTIPTTVALVRGGPHPDAGKKLIDYLLSEEVEKKLLEANFARASVSTTNAGPRAMKVDYAEAAKNLPAAVEMAMRVLEGK